MTDQAISEREALVRRYIDAFNANDTETMMACLHEDVVHDINEGGREIGKEKFRWFVGMMSRHYDERLADVAIMVSASEGRAAAEFTVHGTYLATAEGLPEATGQRYTLPAGIFFAIEDGLIIRVTTYYNLAEWVRQVEKG